MKHNRVWIWGAAVLMFAGCNSFYDTDSIKLGNPSENVKTTNNGNNLNNTNNLNNSNNSNNSNNLATTPCAECDCTMGCDLSCEADCKSLQCETGQTCDVVLRGDSKIKCETGSVCNVLCLGQCEVDCKEASTCTVQCNDAQCKLHCHLTGPDNTCGFTDCENVDDSCDDRLGCNDTCEK